MDMKCHSLFYMLAALDVLSLDDVIVVKPVSVILECAYFLYTTQEDLLQILFE